MKKRKEKEQKLLDKLFPKVLPIEHNEKYKKVVSENTRLKAKCSELEEKVEQQKKVLNSIRKKIDKHDPPYDDYDSYDYHD